MAIATRRLLLAMVDVIFVANIHTARSNGDAEQVGGR
jgi:hypothetical protein